MFKTIKRWFRRSSREIHLVSQLRVPKEWIGELVEVHFWDHYKDGDGINHTVARGRIEKFDGMALLLIAWEDDYIIHPRTAKSFAEDKDNRVELWLVRSTITRITRLERKESKHVR